MLGAVAGAAAVGAVAGAPPGGVAGGVRPVFPRPGAVDLVLLPDILVL